MHTAQMLIIDTSAFSMLLRIITRRGACRGGGEEVAGEGTGMVQQGSVGVLRCAVLRCTAGIITGLSMWIGWQKKYPVHPEQVAGS